MIFWPPGCSGHRECDIVKTKLYRNSTWQKFCNVVCLPMHDNPAGILGIVLGDLGASELPLFHRDDYFLTIEWEGIRDERK
jgi:hypothetical protein